MEPNASEDTKGVSWAMEDDGNETKNSSGSAAAMEDASLSADPLALLSSLSPEEFIATVFPRKCFILLSAWVFGFSNYVCDMWTDAVWKFCGCLTVEGVSVLMVWGSSVRGEGLTVGGVSVLMI